MLNPGLLTHGSYILYPDSSSNHNHPLPSVRSAEPSALSASSSLSASSLLLRIYIYRYTYYDMDDAYIYICIHIHNPYYPSSKLECAQFSEAGSHPDWGPGHQLLAAKGPAWGWLEAAAWASDDFDALGSKGPAIWTPGVQVLPGCSWKMTMGSSK